MHEPAQKRQTERGPAQCGCMGEALMFTFPPRGAEAVRIVFTQPIFPAAVILAVCACLEKTNERIEEMNMARSEERRVGKECRL